MKNEQITVVYSWTAKEGKSRELKAIYDDVTKQMNETEPGALADYFTQADPPVSL